ncbi:MAG: DNA polymerase II [Nanoarchaeota archaeon]
MKGFILYSDYKVIDGKEYVFLYGKLENNETFLTINHYKPYFYIKESDLNNALKIVNFEHEKNDFKNFNNEPVVKVMALLHKDIISIRERLKENNIPNYESDVKFIDRFLIDNQINSSLEIEGEHERNERIDRIYREPKLKPSDFIPDLRIVSLDIETSSDGKILYCISLYGKNYSKTFINTKETGLNAVCCKDEMEVLLKFKEEFLKYDPDILTGWNLVDFDLMYLKDKFDEYGIEFDLGRTNERVKIRKGRKFLSSSKADTPGRQVLDCLNLLMISFIKLEDYKLDSAARQILGEGKTMSGKNNHLEIDKLHKSDSKKLIIYNLNDAKLVYDIMLKTKILDLTIQRSLLTGMPLDKVNASIASLDSLYLKEAIKRKIVCPTGKYEEAEERITGGFVMESKPGIYDYVLVLDFKGLYPSIMRTFNIDPHAFTKEKTKDAITAPNKAMFRNEDGILPSILEKLVGARNKAKKEKNLLASQAIKILTNSFFGVLASPSCRFYNLDVANAITHFARYLVQLTTKKINEMGLEVIYSDTDSNFVISKAKNYEEADKIGNKIQDEINNFYKEFIKKEYKRTSHLELQFEKCFIRFLMPKLRGSEKGAKKRYAGLIEDERGKENILFTGMEAVRGDWTDAAKEFQYELLNRIFHKEEIFSFIKKFIKDIREGKLDNKLVYRKSIRKELEEYTKITPPHVKAARKLDKLESNIIEYYITEDGPEPIQKLKHKIDYEYYIKKQIKPIADSILVFFNKNFDDMTKESKQTKLFED